MATIPISAFDDEIAKERGRRLAAQAIANNPEQKRHIESIYGVEACRRRYPEAYKRGFGRFLDRVFPSLSRR
jgi:hypothetical protein